MYEATGQALDKAGSDLGPTLIEAVVYRHAPHTSNDDDRVYRTKEEVDAWALDANTDSVDAVSNACSTKPGCYTSQSILASPER